MILGEGAIIGGAGEVVVFDGTHMGVHKGIATRTDRHRVNNPDSKPVRRNRIAQKLPARTIWKKPAAAGVLRRPAAAKRPAAAGILRIPAAVLRRPARKGPRINAKWLWMAVTVGKGRERYTHESGKKKVRFTFFPRREHAPAGTPRGLEPMSRVIKQHIKKNGRSSSSTVGNHRGQQSNGSVSATHRQWTTAL
eukprot:740683-Pyramimonas_sp.AAC.1